MTTIEKVLGVLLIISVIMILVMSNRDKIENEEYQNQKKELLKDIKDINKKYESSKKEAAIFKARWHYADSLLKDPKQYDYVKKDYIQTIDSIDNADWNKLIILWTR